MVTLLHVATIQRLNNIGHDFWKYKSQINVSDTSVTLNQGQSHQTWYDLVDPTQDFNNTNLKYLALTVSEESQTLNFSFQTRKYVNYLLEYVRKSKIVAYPSIMQSFN